MLRMDSCAQTTTADWVFSLTLASGTVALFAGIACVVVVARSDPRPAPGPPRSRWTWLRLLPVLVVVWNLATHGDTLWTGQHEALITGGTLVLVTFPLAGLFLMKRRFTQTGHWPRGRRAPLGMYWLLPVLVLAAVLTCVWSVYAQIASMVPC